MGDAAGVKLLFLIVALAIFGLRLFLRHGGGSERNQPMPDADDPRWDHNRGREPPPKKKKKKKKKPGADAPAGGDASMEALMKAMQNDKQPRPRHYGFAHGKLRMLLRTGSVVWPMFRDAKSEAELNLLVDKAWEGEEGASDAGAYPWKPTGRTIDGGVLIRMPPPEGTTEAYFIAALETESEGEKKVRYFTLEKSLLGAVLCEWTDSIHANMGDCPTDEEGFLAAVRNKLS